MKTPKPQIPVIVACLAGAIAGFLFLTVNDPDKVGTGTMQKFGWLVLCPSAFVLALISGRAFLLVALGMLAGIFTGVCVRCLIPPTQSNIWPIAGVLWTALFVLPVAVGALGGGLGSWCLRRWVK